MKKGTNTKKKKNNEYIYIGKRTFTVFEAPSGNKYIQAKFGTKPDGKPLIKKITAPTRQELEQAIKDYIAEIEGISGANITYYNAAMTYIETRQGLEFSTRTNYDRTARLRFKCLHSIPIRKITKNDLYNAVNEEIASGKVGQTSLLNAVTYLCTVLEDNEAPVMTRKMRKDILRYARSATKNIKKRKVGWSELPTAKDVAGWAARNTRSAAASTAISILLDLHSLRSEETRGLKYRDVFEQNGKCYIYVWQTKTCINNVDIHKPSTKTEASTRKILIDRRLYDMIHAQPHKSDDEFIIKETYPTYCNHIKAVMKDNGHPELTPHKLRHIFKSDNKRDNVVAIAVGGWCSGTNADGGDRSENGVSETVYTHVRQCEMDELMEKYSKELLDAYDGTAASAVRIIVSRMVG